MGNNKYKQRARANDSSEAVAKYFRYGFIGFIALIVVAVALVVFFTYRESYVASVGGQKISAAEYRFFLTQEKNNMLAIANVQQGTPEAETFWSSKIDGENAIDVAKKKALDRATELKIQVIKAKEQGIKLEKADTDGLDNAIKTFIKSNNDSRTEANKASEELYGVKLDELRNVYKQILLMQKLFDKETKEMNFSEDELRKYYDENIKSFETATVKHILISSKEEDPDEKKEEARKKAEDILAKVRAGEDFASLAKEYSEDPGSKDNGGEYTFKRNGQMVKEFEDWAFEKNIGDTGIVTTEFGYHVMKLEKRETKSFDDAKEEIKATISSDKYEKLLEEWKKDSKYGLVKNQPVYDGIK